MSDSARRQGPLLLKLYITEGIEPTARRQGHLSVAASNDLPSPAARRASPPTAATSTAGSGDLADFDRWDQRHRPSLNEGGEPGRRIAVVNNTAQPFGGTNIVAMGSVGARARPVNAPGLNVEPLARNFAFWLEEQYQMHSFEVDGSKMVPIFVNDLPPQSITDQALLMLQQRGWLVTGPAVSDDSKVRSGTVRMALRFF